MSKAFLIRGVAAIAMSVGSQAAYAQAAADTDTSNQGIGEIVVTAQRREESLQKVPIAVSAVTSDALARTGQVSVESLSGQVPNLNVSQNIGQARVTIRGIGIDSISLGSEGSIAFYQDGVFFTRSTAALASFFDIDHVEVLRGPQGTLYGRNATGGSINIFTKAPSKENEGYVSLTGGNYGTINTEGALNAVLSDSVQARISFQTRNNNGFGKNIVTGNKIDDENSQAVRGQIKFESGALTVLAEADYYKKDDASNGGHYFGRGLQISRNGPFAVPQGESLGGVVAGDVRDVSNARDPFVKAEFYGGRLDVHYDVSDSVSLRSLTSARHTDFDSLTDISGSSYDLFPLYNWEYDDQFSQELQLNYNSDRHKMVLGAYYLHDKVDGGSRGEFSLGPYGYPGYYAQGYWAGGVQKTDTFAVFGQDSISLTDRLRVTLGARYSHEKKDIHNVVEFNFVDFYSPTYTVQTPYRNASKSWNSFTPKVGVDFDLADRVMVYASYSKGFKAGLFDLEAVNAAVNPEKVDAFDAGIKVTTNSVRANLAGFYYKYKDMQVGKVTGAALLLENAASATIYGLEGEFTVKPIPAPLTLSVSASWLHARFDDFISEDPARTFGDGVTTLNGNPAFNLHGHALPQAPDYSINASLEYVIETGAGDFTLRGESLWSGKFYFDGFNTPQASQGAYNLQNASITFNSADKNWMVSAFIRNIADKTVISSAHVGYVPIGAPILGYLMPPRTFGLTVRRNF